MISLSFARASALFLASALLSPFLPSCANKSPTAIVLAISSEALVPKEIDAISLEVQRGSTTTFARSYAVDPLTGQAHLPGSLTFSLHPDEDLSEQVRILMKADQKGEQVSLRSATLNFVDGKTKLLRMELRFSCLDFPKACVEGETCLAGKCQKDFVEASKLPDAPEDATKVFPTTAEGGCFDNRDDDGAVDKCAAGRVDLDRASLVGKKCVLDMNGMKDAKGNTFDPTKLNVFALWSAQSDQAHPTVLDQDQQEGWFYHDNSTSTWQLAGNLCDQFSSGQIEKLSFNFACATKTKAVPACLPDPLKPPAVTTLEGSKCSDSTYKNPIKQCDKAFENALTEPESALRLKAAFACTYDGRYSSLDECEAVRACFLGALLPLLQCESTGDCDTKYPKGRAWASCVGTVPLDPLSQACEMENLPVCRVTAPSP